MRPPLITADFVGQWSLTRRIEDARAGQDSRFTGAAWFTPEGDALCYREEGQLSVPGQGAFTATRRYYWRSDGAEIAVLFADGRPFHRFDPAVPAPKALHDCPPDTYRVAYDFTGWPRWQARWEVEGPRKRYTMLSCYAPLPGAETHPEAQQWGR